MTDNIYQQAIIDEAQNPRNQGSLDVIGATGNEVISHQETNASCGDEVIIYLKLSKDEKIVKDIRWSGHGCVVSQASMSVLSDKIKGTEVQKIKAWTKKDLLPFFGMETISAGREKCFMMGLRAVQKMLV